MFTPLLVLSPTTFSALYNLSDFFITTDYTDFALIKISQSVLICVICGEIISQYETS